MSQQAKKKQFESRCDLIGDSLGDSLDESVGESFEGSIQRLPDGSAAPSQSNTALSDEESHCLSSRLIALDLDGTLLNSSGHVSQANIDAIRQAQSCGETVIACTGRGYVEAKHILNAAGLNGLGVFNTGAMVVEHPSGQTDQAWPIEVELVQKLVERLGHHDEAVLLYCDQQACGYDYLVTGQGELMANSQWWFKQVGAEVVYKPDCSQCDLSHCVRVGVVGEVNKMQQHAEAVLSDFLGQLEAHAFEAVLEKNGDRVFSILEIFAAQTNKWQGIEAVMKSLGMNAEQVVFVGDQINDLAALKYAGLGIAMGNAVDSAKQAADLVIDYTNDQDGVAWVIEALIAGDLVMPGNGE